MTSRFRNLFKQQDSFSGTTPELTSYHSPTLNGDIELDAKHNSDKDDNVPSHQASAHVIDPSALGVEDLDPVNRLENGKERPIETANDFGTRLVALEDDVDMPIHTLRMYVLGLGMTCFAGVLGQIFFYRPSSLTVSSLFVLVISHVLGRLWHTILPKAHHGRFWAFLNPCEFNQKEHVAILICSTTAFSSAMAISVFAADDLYYDLDTNWGIAIFTLIGSQFLGYGIAGLCRSIVVFPTYAVWPTVLPTVQLFQLLHTDKDVSEQRKRFKFFGVIFIAIFVWEWFPEFIAPTLTGVSIFCLAKRDGVWWSRVFGGAYPNEGMGIFSICLDWAYLSGSSPLYTPLETQLSLYAGVALSAIVICAAYAGNAWNAQNFPFLAQDLYLANGSLYDQTVILDSDYQLNRTALESYGLPWQTTSMALYYLGLNLSIGATITHCLLWYWGPVKEAFLGFRTRSIDDPHYRNMLRYKEVPMWVYGSIVLISFAMAMATCYTGDSHLPWYGVIVAFLIAFILFPFVSIFTSITGWQIDGSTLVLMLGSAVVPGNSQANMYFSLYGSNSSTQGISFASDLKLAQYSKLPPRTTLWVQSLGTVVGGILQIVISKQILATHRDILLDPVGNNIWSGQNVQSFNSQAVTWGALGKDMYSPGTTYEMVPMAVLVGLAVPVIPFLIHRWNPRLHLNKLITPMFCYTLGYLGSGINSSLFMAFTIAILSQWYWRKYHPTTFRRYNYILSASLDAGMEVFVFILTFAIQGAGNGTTVYFPSWGLNPGNTNIDYCMET